MSSLYSPSAMHIAKRQLAEKVHEAIQEFEKSTSMTVLGFDLDALRNDSVPKEESVKAEKPS